MEFARFFLPVLLFSAGVSVATARGDLGDALKTGDIWTTPPQEFSFLKGEVFSWIKKGNRASFPAPGVTLESHELGSATLGLQSGRPLFLLFTVLQNDGTNNTTVEPYKSMLDSLKGRLSKIMGQGRAIPSGIFWKTDKGDALLSYKDRKKPDGTTEPDRLVLILSSPGMTGRALSELPESQS